MTNNGKTEEPTKPSPSPVHSDAFAIPKWFVGLVGFILIPAGSLVGHLTLASSDHESRIDVIEKKSATLEAIAIRQTEHNARIASLESGRAEIRATIEAQTKEIIELRLQIERLLVIRPADVYKKIEGLERMIEELKAERKEGASTMKNKATTTAGLRYDPAEANRLAKLSAVAYLNDPVEITREAQKLGASKAYLVDAGSAEAVVAKFGQDVAVAFRGSSELDDWFRDARFLTRTHAGIPGRVHGGFLSCVLEIFASLFSEIKANRGPDGFIKIAGHSKGGAEAMIFAAMLRASGDWRTNAVHAFGAPAVGDPMFAREYDHALGLVTFRHVYGSDVVARAPIWLRLRRKYRTVGQLVYHYRDGGSSFSPSPLLYLVDSIRGFSRRLGRRDHSLANYIRSTSQCDNC